MRRAAAGEPANEASANEASADVPVAEVPPPAPSIGFDVPERQLGELLVRSDFVSALDLIQLTKDRVVHGPRIAQMLISKGMVSEDDFLSFLVDQYQHPAIDLDEFTIEKDVVQLVPAR